MKLFDCLLKPARGVQIDGQNSRLPAYNETPVSDNVFILCVHMISGLEARKRHFKNHFFAYKTTTKTNRPFLSQGIDLDDIRDFQNYMTHTCT